MTHHRATQLWALGEVGLCLVLSAVVIAVLCQGCGASALSTHARAATTTAGILSIAHESLYDARGHALDACTDTACLDSTERAWVPAEAAYDGTRGAWLLWSQSIQIAGLSGDADALALSLAQSLAAVIAQWRSLCASMLSLGISLPMPPAFVLTIVGQP